MFQCSLISSITPSRLVAFSCSKCVDLCTLRLSALARNRSPSRRQMAAIQRTAVVHRVVCAWPKFLPRRLLAAGFRMPLGLSRRDKADKSVNPVRELDEFQGVYCCAASTARCAARTPRVNHSQKKRSIHWCAGGARSRIGCHSVRWSSVAVRLGIVPATTP